MSYSPEMPLPERVHEATGDPRRNFLVSANHYIRHPGTVTGRILDIKTTTLQNSVGAALQEVVFSDQCDEIAKAAIITNLQDTIRRERRRNFNDYLGYPRFTVDEESEISIPEADGDYSCLISEFCLDPNEWLEMEINAFKEHLAWDVDQLKGSRRVHRPGSRLKLLAPAAGVLGLGLAGSALWSKKINPRTERGKL